MRIQNNITALNTHRQYTINNDNVAKSAEKLSSGYRINRAADDAAGLAISEKMRSQIRGLNMATKNSQDAISLVQTAEGALQETHSMLQRMNELAVQAATGTNQDFDKIQAAKEFEQLKREINDVAESTTFNNMKILDGSLSYKGYERSAATAGVTVTKPTKLEGATSSASSSSAAPALGAVVSGFTIDAADLTQDIADGKAATITATYTDADGVEQKLEFKATNADGTGAAQDIGTLFAAANKANITSPEGWGIEVDANGAVKLTATKDPNMAEGTKVNMSLSTNDSAAAANITTAAADATVELVQSKAAEKATVTIDTSSINNSANATSVGMDVTIDGTVFKVQAAKASGNFGTAGALNGKLAATDTITVTDDQGNATDAWVGSIDGSGNIVLTAKDAPASADEAKKPEATVSNFTGTSGTPSATATGVAGAAAEDTGAAKAATVAGGSIGATAAADGTNDGKKHTITLNIGGEDVNFTSDKRLDASGTPATVGALFADGVTSEDGKWTMKMDAATGNYTLTATEPGETKLEGKVTLTSIKTADGAATVTPTTSEVKDGTITNGTAGQAKTSGGSSEVTTIEFGFDKLRDGDKVSINVGGKAIEVTREASDTRDSFIKKLEDAVAANGYAEGTVKVSGTAIVVQDGIAVDDEAELDTTNSTDLENTTAMRIQVGALENEQLNIAIDSMNTAGLGLDGMNLETQDNAGKAITAVRSAVLKVSDQRATLGAMQNRLDHKIANLKVTSENLSAAESRIRDVDMASEMTNFTKNNILSQAATAMLAQANALPQNVLSLLG